LLILHCLADSAAIAVTGLSIPLFLPPVFIAHFLASADVRGVALTSLADSDLIII
jgi:hypothetical protein